MKKFLLAPVFALAATAFANDTKPATTPPPAAEPATTQAAPAKKLSHKEAKAACQKETPGIKGKDLKTCIKGKRANG